MGMQKLVALALCTMCWLPSGDAVRMLGAGVAWPSSPASYAMAGQSAVLECRFALEPGEALQGVTWTKDAQLVYRWLPAGRAQAFGALENVTATAFPGREAGPQGPQPGWNVRVARATTAMAGNYSCSAHTDRGSATSRRFHFAVLLVCKARIETEDSTGVNCTVGWRLSCARVFPDLNLTAGVFDQGRFVDRVTEWTKVVYSDNTYGYHAFKSYHVAEIPKSSVFLWSLSYRNLTPLVTGNVSSGAVHRAWSGCPEPPPPRDASLQVRLSHAGTGCRAGPGATGATRALYSCTNEVQDRQDAKELKCAEGEWVEADPSMPWPLC